MKLIEKGKKRKIKELRIKKRPTVHLIFFIVYRGNTISLTLDIPITPTHTTYVQ